MTRKPQTKDRRSLQLVLEFEPSLVDKFETAMDCIRTAVYSSSKPLKAVAADMDLSQSDLSRKLHQNPDDTRRFSVDDLEKYVEKTGDTTPILYLAAKHLGDNEIIKKAAVQRFLKQMPEMLELAKAFLEKDGVE